MKENVDRQPFQGGHRALQLSFAVAALGVAGCVIGLLTNARQTLAAWLIAWFFAVTVALGLLAFVLTAYIMNAAWPATVRRLAEAGFSSLVLLAALWTPLIFAIDRLYPWAHPERIADARLRALVEHKTPIMNAPFFFLRVVLFLLLWVAVAEFLRASSLRSRSSNDRLRAFSSVALPLIGLTGTFATFDQLMSLSPDFYSTMYGLYTLSGGFVAAIGVIAVAALAAQRSGRLAFVSTSHWYALGRLLFAFLIFWAYTGFFQYMLIWIANKPVEARFYIERFRADDHATSWFLIVGHFALPWLILMSYAVKRSRVWVAGMGAWLIACHYVDVHWLVGADRGAAPWQWQDLPALAAISGSTVAFALWRQRGQLLAAVDDPDFAAGAAYESR
jgi:hypothetical protein